MLGLYVGPSTVVGISYNGTPKQKDRECMPLKMNCQLGRLAVCTTALQAMRCGRMDVLYDRNYIKVCNIHAGIRLRAVGSTSSAAAYSYVANSSAGELHMA